MYNVVRLIKNYVLNFFGSILKKQKTPKFYIAVLLCVAFSLLIIGTFTMNAVSSIQLYIEQDVEHPELLAMFSTTTLALMMLLFVTIMRSVYPSKGSDYELLLSMPIKKIHIVLAKSIYNYLFDLFIFIGILVPNYIVFYFMIPGTSFYVITRGVTFVFILPLISNAIAAFVGILSDKMSRMFKRYSLVQTIISLVLISMYLVSNYSLQSYLSKVTGSAVDVIESIFIIDFILDFILYGKGVNLIVIALIAVALYVCSLFYTASQIGKLQKESRTENKKLVFKSNSVLWALTKKEFKQYINSPIYLINTIIPLVLYLGLSIAAFIFGKEFALSFVSMLPSTFVANFDIFVLMLFTLLVSGFVITGCSISLEGKHFWIIRTNPIKTSTIFLSKVFVNVLIAGLFVLIGFPFILSFVELSNCWWFIVVPIVSSVLSSLIGLTINLNFPKLEWDREESVVKSSLSSLLSIFLPMILSLIPFVVYIVSLNKVITPFSFVYFLVMYDLILILLLCLWLKNHGEEALYNAAVHKS